MPFFVRLIFIALGLVGVINPRLAWYLSDGWKFRDAEPSDTALFMARLGGIAMLGVAIFVR